MGVGTLHATSSARTKDRRGTEHIVIVEIQRAKVHRQDMRFRKYLGKDVARNVPTIGTDRFSPLARSIARHNAVREVFYTSPNSSTDFCAAGKKRK